MTIKKRYHNIGMKTWRLLPEKFHSDGIFLLTEYSASQNLKKLFPFLCIKKSVKFTN